MKAGKSIAPAHDIGDQQSAAFVRPVNHVLLIPKVLKKKIMNSCFLLLFIHNLLKFKLRSLFNSNGLRG